MIEIHDIIRRRRDFLVSSKHIQLYVLDIYGLNEYSINAESMRGDADWVAGKAIPGPHGSPIGSTDENYRIA